MQLSLRTAHVWAQDLLKISDHSLFSYFSVQNVSVRLANQLDLLCSNCR